MDKKRTALCALLLFYICLMAAGCSKKEDKLLKAEDLEANTILVGSDGSVQEAIVESFEKEFYEKNKLEEYISEEIDHYNAKAGANAVSLNSLQIAGEKVKVLINYKNISHYAQLNRVEAKLLTMEEAAQEGVLPDILTEAKTNQSVAKSEAEKNKKLKVLIIREPLNVIVNGTVKYFSEGALLNMNTVETSGEADTVILYK